MRRGTLDSLRPTFAALGLLLCACSDGSGAAASSSIAGSSSTAGGTTGTGGASTGGAVSTTGGTGAGGAKAGGGASGNSATGGVAPATGGSSGGPGTGGIASGAPGTGGSVSGSSGAVGTAGNATGGAQSTGGNNSAGAGGIAGSGAGGTQGTAGSATGGAGTAGGSGTGSAKLIGFATENGGTTGGMGGETVTATTYAQLKSYAESSTAYVIMVEGTIENGADGGRINVESNKSIIGVGSTAFLNGVGLDISSANNVIVQNLRISLIGVTTRTNKDGVYSSTGDEGRPQILVNGGDAISISGTSKNIWIDHCELFSEDPDQQTNIDLYDGLIDVKNETGFITISWCYLHDQHKGGLVGADDDDIYADRKITYHHNYYDNVKLRVPMYRGSTGHFFNNYVVGAEDASEIRADSCVRIEKNYYEALHYSIYTSSDSTGNAERIDNIEIEREDRAYPPSCTAQIPYMYQDALTANTEDVKTVVPAGAGVGKL